MSEDHIVRADIARLKLPLSVPYGITNEWIDSTTILVLSLSTQEGLLAYGAATPSPRITGDTLDGTEAILNESVVPWLRGSPVAQPLDLLDEAPPQLGGCPAALAAVDIALHDLHAKQLGMPLHRWLGTRPDDLITSVTVGICDVDETVKQGRAHVDAGFACIKVKIGEVLDDDVARLQALRKAIGAGVRVRVDANQGYDAEDACRFLDAVKELRIELLEQPTRKGDLDGLRQVTEYAAPLPVMADEDVVSVADAHRVLEVKAASAINIKLMKCGGIRAAREISAAAREQNVRCMLGCFDESRISMAAAAHLALSDDQFWWADLDGHLDLAHDVARGGINIAAGRVSVPNQPGLGVDVDPSLFAKDS